MKEIGSFALSLLLLLLTNLAWGATPASPISSSEATTPVAGPIDAGPQFESAAMILVEEFELATMQQAGAPDLLARELSPTEILLENRAREGDASEDADSERLQILQTPEPAPLGLRLLSETGGMFVGATAGAIVGGGLGFVTGLIALQVTDVRADFERLAVVFGATAIGGAVGMFTVAPLGLWAGGHFAGGRGNLGWTYVGTVGGLLAAVGMAAASDRLAPEQTARTLARFAVLTLPLTGGILGFELSHAARTRKGNARGQSAPPRWTPTVSPAVSTNEPHQLRGFSVGMNVRF